MIEHYGSESVNYKFDFQPGAQEITVYQWMKT